MKQIIKKLGSFPYYVFGIIVFFLSHGYSENTGLIAFSEMILFFLALAVISIFILWFFRKKMGSIFKAGIVAGLMLSFYLFYGAFQDGLRASRFLDQLSRYRVLLPAIVIMTMLVYFFIKRSTRDFKRVTIYMNTVLLVLIALDFISISRYFFRGRDRDELKKNIISRSLLPCDTCRKPDIYLIVLDEYWGNHSLKSYFNYDNSNFISFLKREGFFIAATPFANYTSTPLSMASMFDMKYIEWLNGRKQVQAEDYGTAAKSITNSVTMMFLQSLGYRVKNCSIFDILNQPSEFNFGLLPIKLRLITSKTLLSRMEKDLLWYLRVNIASKVNWLASNFQNEFKKGNNELVQLTYEQISANDNPKFVYSHLMMPHLPHLYDSSGRENNINFYQDLPQKVIDDTYLGYLIYSNKIAHNLIEKIKKESGSKAVIILMSDHGYRSYDAANRNVSANNNFNAVFLPEKNYNLFYDSISNVNQFRALFNTLFNQQLPILKDSVVF